jgi:polyisoprenoid-binding protein YceI
MQVSFAIRVMRVTTTRGRFKTLRGRFHIDEQHPTNSWVEAEVHAASIDTHNGLRDAHLRSDAFFAVKQYPKITFQSTQVAPVGDQTYQVTGKLTLRGVTRPVTFDVTYRGQNALLGAHLSASTTINRNDFDVGRGLGVRVAAGALVSIELELEVVQQSSEMQETATRAHEQEKAHGDQQPTAYSIAATD